MKMKSKVVHCTFEMFECCRGGAVWEWCGSGSCRECREGVAVGLLPKQWAWLQGHLLHQDPRIAQASLSISGDQKEHREKPIPEHSSRESAFFHPFLRVVQFRREKGKKKRSPVSFQANSRLDKSLCSEWCPGHSFHLNILWQERLPFIKVSNQRPNRLPNVSSWCQSFQRSR